MNSREWALVAFTLLMQTSVGVVLVAAGLHAVASRAPVHGSARGLDLPLLVAVAAGVLALLASLLHLGHPLQAWLALTNVRSSWLSREVLLAAFFVACAAGYAAVARSTPVSPAPRTFAVVAAVLGVLTIAAMSRLYMVPAQPAWNRAATPVSFFATALLLGVIVVLLLADFRGTAGADATAVTRGLRPLAIGLLAVQVLLLPVLVSAFVREPAAAISVGSVGAAATWLAAARAAAAVAAILLLAISTRPLPAPPAFTALALLVLVVVSEVCGRVLFYAGSVHLGRV